MQKVLKDKDSFWKTKNIYEEYPLDIILVNPFKSSLMKKISIPFKKNNKVVGGVDHKSKKLQLGDLSAFDKDISTIKSEDYDRTSYEGDPSKVMVYPPDNVITLRDKIYVATGIPPFRQHLLLKDNKGNISLSYNITAANVFIDINIFNELQKEHTNVIMNIPIDTEVYNRRSDLYVKMNDMKTNLLIDDDTYISSIIVCDLFTILDPNNDTTNIMIQSEQHRELLYYGFIIKYFPLLTFEGFNHVYLKKEDLSYLYPYLKQPIGKLKKKFEKEKELLNKLYKNIPQAAKYVKNITKRELYYITYINAIVNIPPLNIRNLFDNLKLDELFIYSALKFKIEQNLFWVDKRYLLVDDQIQEINYNKLAIDSMYILVGDGTKITITKDLINIEMNYNEDDHITFDDAIIQIENLLEPLIKRINNLGLLILTDGIKLDLNLLNIQITNSSIDSIWPENCSSEQFSQFKRVIQDYEDIDVLTLKLSTVGQYEISFSLGLNCCGPQKTKAILSQIPEIWNKYEYYSNDTIMSKWNDMARNTITFIQKASNVTMVGSGFSKKEFQMLQPLIMSMFYGFSKDICSRMIIEDTEKVSKRLKKLKGIDPDLFVLRRYDPDITVYSVKCQLDRQPVIYKEQEIKTLAKSIRNRLIKFWNFTEQKPVYYDCPNRTYPHLSFRPHDHPLGYCLPCCKKLVPSTESRQAKIDKLCHEKHIIPHQKINELIKTLDKEYSHILSYNKSIPIDRTSYISPLFENNVLMSKTKYRLIGVSQNLPLIEEGGFIFSIIKCLGITLEKYAKDIIKIINKDNYGLLDEGHTMKLESADQLKNILVDMMINSETPNIGIDFSIIDWINVFTELTHMVYRIHIIILMDYEGELKMRMINSSQIAIMEKNPENKFIILNAHDNGIYPIVELPDKMIFNNTTDSIMVNITDILLSIMNNIEYTGITLNNIIEFTKYNKNYKIDYLARGKRGLIYAIILKNNIYIPCIYTEYTSTNYKTQSTF